MFKLNLDKNLIGNVVIIVSVLLVLACFFMVLTTDVVNQTAPSEVEWNGFRYLHFEPDNTVEINNEDTLKVTSQYPSHCIELKKTKDQTNFKEHFGKDGSNAGVSDYNDTHKLMDSMSGDPYAAIVPNDAYEFKGGHYELKENTEFIEVIGGGSDYRMSFLYSVEEVK